MLLESLKRQLRRPPVVLAILALGFVVFFPHFGPAEVTFHYRLPPCAEELRVSAFQGETLARRHSEMLARGAAPEHSFELPKGEYRLHAEVGCAGSETGEVEETLVLEHGGDVDLDLSRACACR